MTRGFVTQLRPRIGPIALVWSTSGAGESAHGPDALPFVNAE